MRFFYLFLFMVYSLLAQAQKENGYITVYSDDYKGMATSSGELYDREAYTGAHRTLPFGSIVRIRNPKTNKKIDIIINDRGAFIKGHLLEISAAAGRKLRISSKAKANIEVLSLGVQKEKEFSDLNRTTKEIPALTIDKVKPSIYASPEDEPEEIKPIEKENIVAQNNLTPKSVKEKKAIQPNLNRIDNNFEALKPLNKSGFKKYNTFKVSINKNVFSGYAIQVGIYHEFNSALKKAAILNENWNCDILLIKNLNSYQILIGAFKNKSEAKRYFENASASGLKGYVTALEKYENKDIYQFEVTKLNKKGYTILLDQLSEYEALLSKFLSLQSNNISDLTIKSKKGNESGMKYQFSLGAFSTKEKANTFLESIRESNITGEITPL